LSVHLSSNKIDEATFIALVDLNVTVEVSFNSAYDIDLVEIPQVSLWLVGLDSWGKLL
jgi:hypothetical protein